MLRMFVLHVLFLRVAMDLMYFLLLNLIPLEFVSLIDIFKYKNINNAIYFHCDPLLKVIGIQKMFFNNQMYMLNLNHQSGSFKIAKSHSRIGIIVNSSCEEWASIFQSIVEFSPEDKFQSPFNWFILTQNFSLTHRVLTQYPIQVNSEVMVVAKSRANSLDLYEVYNTGYYTQGRFVIKRIGFWDSKLNVERRNRFNLTGVVLKGAVVVTQNLVNETFEEYVERSRIHKSDTLHKLKFYTLLKYLRDLYNFSYELLRTTSWGYLRNGSFDGMIGALQRKEVDIGCSPVFYRQERARVLDAAAEVWPTRPVFILRHPKHPGGYFTIFTRPLSTKVWYCIIGVLFVSALLLSLLCKLRFLKHQGDDDDSSFSLALLTIFCAICQQGSSLSRSSTSIRLVIFVTFLFTLTIYQYYNATVVSTLLRDPPKNIRTPKDLLKSGLKAGVHDVLYNKDFFKRTTDEVALEIYRKKIVTASEYNFYSLEHGMALVKKGGFAFLVDNAIAYGKMKTTFTEREICEAHELALYPPQNTAAVLRKESPYKEHFAYGLRKTLESGLMQRIRSVWDEPRPACVRTPDTSLITVSLHEFSTPLLLLTAGTFAAILILLGEIIMHSGADYLKKLNFWSFLTKKPTMLYGRMKCWRCRRK